jgi:hypothetical protein
MSVAEERQTMNLADEAVEAEFDRQMERLLDTLQPGRPKEVFGGMCDEWAAQIGRLDWVDPALFRAAVTAWLLASDELPTLRQFVSLLREQASARRQQEAKVLPPPEPRFTGRPSNATLLRHIAIGKLRARHTNTEHSWLLSDNGFQPDSHPFTDAEIDAVLDEMARRREFESLRRLPEEAPPLDALAALGVPPPGPVTAGEWPR